MTCLYFTCPRSKCVATASLNLFENSLMQDNKCRMKAFKCERCPNQSNQWDGDQALKRALTVKPKGPISSVFQRQDVENNRMNPMTPRFIIISSDINGLNHALGLYLCVYFINPISAGTFTYQSAGVPHSRY